MILVSVIVAKRLALVAVTTSRRPVDTVDLNIAKDRTVTGWFSTLVTLTSHHESVRAVAGRENEDMEEIGRGRLPGERGRGVKSEIKDTETHIEMIGDIEEAFVIYCISHTCS